jgi:hypothetical protein
MFVSVAYDGDYDRVFTSRGLSQLSCHVASVQVWEPDIQEDELRPQLGGLRNRRAPARGVSRSVSCFQQEHE